MVQITKRITQFVWYGSTTSLNSVAWRTSVQLVSTVNAAGTGRSTYDPTVALNSLTSVSSGQIIEVVALAASYAGAGFAIDNGVAPTSTGTSAVRLVATFPANSTSAVAMPVLYADEPGVYSLDTANPAVGISNVSYAKAGVAVTLPVTLAAGEVLAATATAAAGQDGRLVLLKA